VVMVAASAWLQPRGAWVKAVAARTENWAAKPSMPSPGVPVKSQPTGPLGSLILPLREEAGNDMVAPPELRHTFAHRFDHAGAVGHQYPTVSGRDAAICDQQVVIVERGRVERDPDLARPGLTRVRDVLDLDPIQAARRTKNCGFHHDLALRAAAARPSSQS
jgi:hypothetical protein